MKNTPNPIYPRTRAAIADLFTSFELLEPGLVSTSQWRPDSARDIEHAPTDDPILAGVAIKL